MPIYEYECRKCKAHNEVFQKMTDKALTKCRACGGRLEKQWSQTGFQFKGSGWYVTDYAGRKAETNETTATNGKADAAAGETKTATTETASKESGESKKKEKKMEKPAPSSTTNKD